MSKDGLASDSGVTDVTLSSLHVFKQNSGKLSSVTFGEEIPWEIARVFFISVDDPETRGDHAHIRCNQAFICTMGSVRIVCKDGVNEKSFTLDALQQLLIVPAGIWVNLNMEEHSSVAVLTDLPYDEHDYLRSWQEYEAFRKKS